MKFSREDIDSGLAGFLGFLVFGLIMGWTRTSSLLFVEAITRYNVDRKQASFPFILCYMVRNIVGPVVGFAVKLFGLRAVTISGCLFSTFGIVGCFFAEDILTVTILWGVLYGYFRDTLQSYDGLFYVLIGICCVNGFICILIPHIVAWKKNRTK